MDTRQQDNPNADITRHQISMALALLRDSLSYWSKEPTSADFKPPALVPQLQERCERVLWLLNTEEILGQPSDVRQHWFRDASIIFERVTAAANARQQYLHPLANDYRRAQMARLVEFGIDEAYKKAKKLAGQLELDRLTIKGGPEKIHPLATSIRALERALTVIGHPELWCQGSEAKNRRGVPVKWHHVHAHAFSIVGAIYATTQHVEPDQQFDAFAFVGYVAKVRNTQALQEWNDAAATNHAKVIKTIRLAIKLMTESEKRNWQVDFNL
jgi:hypothetical protein